MGNTDSDKTHVKLAADANLDNISQDKVERNDDDLIQPKEETEVAVEVNTKVDSTLPMEQKHTGADNATITASEEAVAAETSENLAPGDIVEAKLIVASDGDEQPHGFVTGRKTFPAKLYDILADERYSNVISWMPHGRSWKVHDQNLFEKNIMPIYFQQTKFASFARQVTGWGFKRITANGADRNSYFHELFLRSEPQLILKMKRPVKKRADVSMKGGETFYQDSQTLAAMGMGRGMQPQYQFLAQDPQMLALQGGATGLAYHPQFMNSPAALMGMGANQQMFSNLAGVDPRFQGYGTMNGGMMGGITSNPYGFTNPNMVMNGALGMPMFDNSQLQNRAAFTNMQAQGLVNGVGFNSQQQMQPLQSLQQGRGILTPTDSQQQQQQQVSMSQQQQLQAQQQQLQAQQLENQQLYSQQQEVQNVQASATNEERNI